MKQKIQTLLNQLNHGLVEREDTLKTALLTVLAGENLVLIGPPGTGKSLIARRIAESLAHSSDNNAYFEYLLTKFSTPEEIFGPLSITELKADRFKRNTAGYLPTVNMAFLDEIFKASSSILNALLTILNERIYHNGAEPQRVPMQALIAASNELPTDQEELSSLYDRFLVRSFVDYVSQDNLSHLFENPGARPELSKLTAIDLKKIKDEAVSVTLPPDIVEAMQRIWVQHKEIFKEDRRENLSDRRLKKVIKLLCFSAATNGRSQVDLSDVLLLKDCLWNHQENAIKVRDLIMKTLRSFSHSVPKVEVMTLSAIESGKQTYEVEEDCVTEKAPSAVAQDSAKLNAIVSGFKGSGTAQDPLLIQTVEDLMDLSRPDVGLKGYYFRQTADIDCRGLTSWMNINFSGHYDGGEYAIKHKKIESGWCDLFNSIKAQSSITNLKLEDLRLAFSVESSHITHCASSVGLIRDEANSCTISASKSGGSLIEGNAINCTITTCESEDFLIYKLASNCTITDCLAVLNLNSNNYRNELSFSLRTQDGGIASILDKGSEVSRCFVTGVIRFTDRLHYARFCGIAGVSRSGFIRQCAVGRFDLFGEHVRLESRVAGTVSNKKILDNNASIDSNPGVDDSNGKDGKTVAAALFKQRYFEQTLGWDFDTVWQWDDTNDRPVLRSVGVGASLQQAKTISQKTNMTDLLIQQMRANIWL
ncbi:MAG: AAA family ATPase [Methylobacter sp.]